MADDSAIAAPRYIEFHCSTEHALLSEPLKEIQFTKAARLSSLFSLFLQAEQLDSTASEHSLGSSSSMVRTSKGLVNCTMVSGNTQPHFPGLLSITIIQRLKERMVNG